MRRVPFATHLLIATIILVAAGCRQTTPTAATGALMPLSPTGGSAAPSFQPFSGQTRVTPPPTGSYSVPNNYLGGTAPLGQMGYPSAAMSGTAATQAPPQYGPTGANPQMIGSGVQQSGWTETGTNIAQPPQPNTGVLAPAGFAAGAPMQDPRSGGMQVIDLTGAPAPPGYQPNLVPQAGFTTPTISQGNFNQQRSYSPIRSMPAPGQDNFGGASSAPAGVIAKTPQLQPIANTQSAADQFPAGRYPASQSPAGQYPTGSGGDLSPVATAPTLDPVAPQGTTPSDSLPWRSPGTQQY